MKAHYIELSEKLKVKYPHVAQAMSRDKDYNEYTSLNRRFGPGFSGTKQAEDLRDTIVGEVDLNERTILYKDTLIEYNQGADGIHI